MATTASGVEIPGDSPTTVNATPIQDHWNNLGKSLNGMLVVPVASTAGRSALIAALATDGFTPSAVTPVFVYRADATASMRLEVTEDGTNWRPVGGSVGYDTTGGATAEKVIAHGLGYTPTSIQLTVDRTLCGSETIASLAAVVVWAKDATNFTVRSYRRDTNALFINNTVGYTWTAR